MFSLFYFSLKAVPFTLPPVPAARERIGGFTYPPSSSPCRENPELDWKAAAAERRSSVTERRPSFSDRSPIAFDKERRHSTCDDSGGRRDSVGGGSVCSDSTEGHEGGSGSPTYGRRTSVTDSPAGKEFCYNIF